MASRFDFSAFVACLLRISRNTKETLILLIFAVLDNNLYFNENRINWASFHSNLFISC